MRRRTALDVMGAIVIEKGWCTLVDVIEDFVMPRNNRASVARFCTRWFVLVGNRSRPRKESMVYGHFETEDEARAYARGLQRQSYESAEVAL